LPRIDVRYEGGSYEIRVLPDYLNVKYTYQYIMQLDSDLTPHQAKEVLNVMKYTYNHVKGINEAIILNLIRGVKGGLL